MEHELLWSKYYLISVWNIITHRMILFSGDISFMVGKIPNLSWRKISLGKLSNHLLLITGIKITVAISYILYLLILKYIEHKSVLITDLEWYFINVGFCENFNIIAILTFLMGKLERLSKKLSIWIKSIYLYMTIPTGN